jgi:hypothetical protein
MSIYLDATNIGISAGSDISLNCSALYVSDLTVLTTNTRIKLERGTSDGNYAVIWNKASGRFYLMVITQ